jgi:hypothetical protein
LPISSLLIEAEVLIHLANDAHSWNANSHVQQKAADLAENALVERVIVPMSFATLQAAGTRVDDPAEFNFGFEVPLHDSYIDGKWESEKFWCDWQCKDTRRRVVFLYIPTICGSHNFWTRSIAGHLPNTPMWVPALTRQDRSGISMRPPTDRNGVNNRTAR